MSRQKQSGMDLEEAEREVIAAAAAAHATQLGYDLSRPDTRNLVRDLVVLLRDLWKVKGDNIVEEDLMDLGARLADIAASRRDAARKRILRGR